MPPPDHSLLNLAYHTATRAILAAQMGGESINTATYSNTTHQFLHVKATQRNQQLYVRITAFLSDEQYNLLLDMLELDYPLAQIDIRAYPRLNPINDPEISPYCCSVCGCNLPWNHWRSTRRNPRDRIPELMVSTGVDLRCNDCKAKAVIDAMIETGEATLYLVHPPGHPACLQDRYGLNQFPITTHLTKKVTIPKRTGAATKATRSDLYFIGPDKKGWHASCFATYLDHNLARARRLKHPSRHLPLSGKEPALSQAPDNPITGREPGEVKHVPHHTD